MRYWCSWKCSGSVLHWHLLHFLWLCRCYSYLPFMSLPFLLPVILDACPTLLFSLVWHTLYTFTCGDQGKINNHIIFWSSNCSSGLSVFFSCQNIAIPTSFEFNFSFLAFLPLKLPWSLMVMHKQLCACGCGEWVTQKVESQHIDACVRGHPIPPLASNSSNLRFNTLPYIPPYHRLPS